MYISVTYRRTNLHKTGRCIGGRYNRSSIRAIFMKASALHSFSSVNICGGSVANAMGLSGRTTTVIGRTDSVTNCGLPCDDMFFNSSSTTTVRRNNVGTITLTTVSPAPTECCRAENSATSGLSPGAVRTNVGVLLRATFLCSDRNLGSRC